MSVDVLPTRARGFSGLTLLILAIALKPLLDIPGEKLAANTVDIGAVVSLGVAAVAIAYGVSCAFRRQHSALLVGQVVLALAYLLLLTDFVLLGSREYLLLYFDRSMPVLFGPFIPPAAGVRLELARFAATFGIVGLLPVIATATPEGGRRWRLFFWAFLSAVAVHVVLAWLQVAGIVPFTFFFRFPGGEIGRASGGYFHPASLGHLLLFAAVLVPIAYRRTLIRSRTLVLLAWAVISATAVITTHRATLLGLVLIFAWEGWSWSRRHLATRSIPLRDMYWLLSLVVIFAAVLGWILLDPVHPIRMAIARVATNLGTLQIGAEGFLRGRGLIWQRLFEFWLASPIGVWLVGLGYEPWNSHNDFIRIGIVHGIIGTSMIGTGIALIVGAIRARLSTASRRDLWLLVCLLLLAALTQKPTSYPYFMWMFFMHAALVASTEVTSSSMEVDE